MQSFAFRNCIFFSNFKAFNSVIIAANCTLISNICIELFSDVTFNATTVKSHP